MNISLSPSASRRAFTLIELLTVIAIIGILAAIIIPTVGRVRESARASQCVSNLRQINLAVQLYVGDNKGFLPPSARAPLPNEGISGSVLWTKAIAPYLPLQGNRADSREHEIFVCPAADYAGLKGKQLSNTYTGTAAFLGLNSAGVADQTAQARKFSSIDSNRLTQIPFIMEGKARTTTPNSTYQTRKWSDAAPDLAVAGPQSTVSFDFRHNGRMNVAYVDGSVRAMDFPAFKILDERTFSGLPPR